MTIVKSCLSTIAKSLREGKARKTIIMAGAGISTASGIPDFRSPGSGLYDNLSQYDLPYPEAIFDINYFRQNPQPFFKLAKALYPGIYPPNAAHYFAKLLQDKGLLLRMYTQNIDGLETEAGVDREHLVEAHGSFATATCQGCLKDYAARDIKDAILSDTLPRCTVCKHVIKPNVVFFGELLPQRFMMHFVDFPICNLLIVMGTSLEVYPFASLADRTFRSVPRLLINQQNVGSFAYDPRENDVVFQGDVVDGVRQLVAECGWQSELEKLEKENS